MEQPLDLSIILTSPPEGSPTEVIAGITVQYETLNLTHTGDLLTNPLTAKEREDFRWYLEEYWKWPYEGFVLRGKHVEDLLVEVGKRLYEAVFGNINVKGIVQTWQQQPVQQRQISIVSNIPGVLSLPWELLHDEDGFLAPRKPHPVSIVRRLRQNELSTQSIALELPLRVLLVTARPKGVSFVDPRIIARELLDEVQEHIEAGTIELEFLRPPTLDALGTRLRDTQRPVYALHFDGHGMFDEEDKTGKLAFEDEEGKLDSIWAQDLARVLRDSGVRLVVLTACHSAVEAADDALSSVATQLIQGGIDAVVAMSASVLQVSAVRYVEAFYRALAAGAPLPTSQEQARQVLYIDPHRHVLHRRRGEEGKPVELRDWWVPHYYQQRPFTLQVQRSAMPVLEDKKLRSAPSAPRLSEGMPPALPYVFIGRTRELLQIERSLLQGRLVVIYGVSGVGKTTLAREAADWLTRTKMYDEAYLVSLENSRDAVTMLLNSLGRSLGVYDSRYDPNDPAVALPRLKRALKERRTLVIVDNLGTNVPRGEFLSETTIRSQLRDVLLELLHMGAGILLTSDNTSLGSGRLVPGNKVTYLALGGLHREDAYILATHLLNDLGIDRRYAPYAELCDLLAQLDHHPLAIQLVLPTLQYLPLSRIKSDFAKLLPELVDTIETNRSKSLLTLLDYSLQGQLSEEQQALLPRLAIFEGGALENDLLTITEIPSYVWVRLRAVLEQGGLLVAEQIHESIPVPFLRFHPILIPYLRSHFGVNDSALNLRYVATYWAVAEYCYFAYDRVPNQVLAQMQRDLPNLQRSLNLLLEMGELQTAAPLVEAITRFLINFGLKRELEQLQQRIAKVVAANAQTKSELTLFEWQHETSLGDHELRSGNVQAASARFEDLLQRMEALSENTPLCHGSHEYCMTLNWLARCLRENGQTLIAAQLQMQALAYINILLTQPERKTEIAQSSSQIKIAQSERKTEQSNRLSLYGVILGDLGNTLLEEGNYQAAEEMYREGLKIEIELGHQRGQASSLVQLGTLALRKGSNLEARSYYIEALKLFHTLHEPTKEAGIWCDLGIIARMEKKQEEAEHCLRKSLAISEQQDDFNRAANACVELGQLAQQSERLVEALEWYRQAIRFNEQVSLDNPSLARHLTDLAVLLIGERHAGVLMAHLDEAQKYAERALSIQETLKVPEVWKTYRILADIAERKGHTEVARSYRLRERNAFVALPSLRNHIDRANGIFFADVAAVTRGKAPKELREGVKVAITRYEAQGLHITDAIRRISAGERDWQSLVENIDAFSAHMVLRILEILVQTAAAQAQMPSEVYDALKRSDQGAFESAMANVSLEERVTVWEFMQQLEVAQSFENILGDTAGVTIVHDRPVSFAVETDRIIDEDLYKLLLMSDEFAKKNSRLRAGYLNSLAVLLLDKVRAYHASTAYLAQARRCAEEALAIEETLDGATEKWHTLHRLAEIADLEGREEEAQEYLLREREAFAADIGNRYYVDGQFKVLIIEIAGAAVGDVESKVWLESVLPQLEKQGVSSAVIERILRGERDWHLLIKGINNLHALLILRVLEAITHTPYKE